MAQKETYQIIIHLIEARQLRGRDAECGFTVNPIVKLTLCFGSTSLPQFSKRYEKRSSVSFDEYRTYDNIEMTRREFEDSRLMVGRACCGAAPRRTARSPNLPAPGPTLRAATGRWMSPTTATCSRASLSAACRWQRALHSSRAARPALTGPCVCSPQLDLPEIYDNDGHEVFGKWFGLLAEDTGATLQGFARLSVTVLKTGDEMKRCAAAPPLAWRRASRAPGRTLGAGTTPTSSTSRTTR